MRSPVVAMLWENWRLSRLEAANRLWLGIIGAAAILALSATVSSEAARNAAANTALSVLVILHCAQWMSIAKLNGGRFLEGYRPGFPFHLLFARPVRTFVLVGVPMAYDAASGVLFYLASALLLRGVFGAQLPLLRIAAWLAAFRLMQTAVQWATRHRVIQWVASIAGSAVVVGVPMYRHGFQRPSQIDLSLADYAFMTAIGLASFGVTVAGVARQRRGDVWAAWPRSAASSGYPDWFVNLFRLPCPTSSATRAQVWFELKATGLPALAIGSAGALLHPLFFAVGGPIDPVRGLAVLWAGLSVLAVLLLGGNAFGIRSKQGRVYATAFMATQACGTARLAGLKVFVRTACLLAALIVVGVSLWISSALVSTWVTYAQRALRVRRTIGTAIGTLSGYELVALTVVVVLLVTIMVAVRASLAALRARYPRRLLIANGVLMLYGLAFVARVWFSDPFLQAGSHGYEALAAWIFQATSWMVAPPIAVATAYLCRACIRERLLTPGHVGGAVLVSVAFGAASVTVLSAAGVHLSEVSTANAVLMLSPALLPLTTCVLAPWSLSRVRHT